MDFFGAQDKARSNTAKLVSLYLLAVVGLVLVIYMFTVFLLHFSGLYGERLSVNSFLQPDLFLIVSLLTIAMIGAGSAYRILQLKKGGGAAVAKMLGGIPVSQSTKNADERQLMNIVEEMAIASGSPMPGVYLLEEEPGINAFAAGHSPHDAVIGVTKGAIEKLDRDQMQGVIAHEFSHILNGDMHLNIRLIGVLNGIICIFLTGTILMRLLYPAGLSRHGRYRSTSINRGSRSDRRLLLFLFLMGIMLLVVGYIGMLFAQMIQAAISRQREFLADSSAVQFTRNPEGIAGALQTINQDIDGSFVGEGHSSEMNHLFFSNGTRSFMNRMFATHPPLDERIGAISPRFLDSAFVEDLKRRKKRNLHQEEDSTTAERKQMINEGITDVFGTGEGQSMEALQPILQPAVILAAIGSMDTANQLPNPVLSHLPKPLTHAVTDPEQSALLLSALLIAGDDPRGHTDIPNWFQKEVGAEKTKLIKYLLSSLETRERTWFLPLAERALKTLKETDVDSLERTCDLWDRLIKASDNEAFFPFVFTYVIKDPLRRHIESDKEDDTEEQEVIHYTFKKLMTETSLLLSVVANASNTRPMDAWQKGCDAIKDYLTAELTYRETDSYTMADVHQAIQPFKESAQPVKMYLLTALVHIIMYDKNLTSSQREWIRAISEGILYPVPANALPIQD